MNYISTRGGTTAKDGLHSADAIKKGLCADGGLFMPEAIPSVSLDEIVEMSRMSYPERAAKILGKFLTDYPADTLLDYCKSAYAEDRFPGGAAPLHKLNDTVNVMELWHGPTCAFKDMALQIMPKLLSGALKITGETRTAFILVATSGDTGKAALEGYRDVEQVKIMVYYPVDGVSKMQKLQMATQEGGNVTVCAIRGNFDDAQTGVKRIFSDPTAAAALAEQGCFFSSANSINWGRLVPQVAYYFSAYCDLLATGEIKAGDAINVSVPTGNFGNIFAGYLAKQMGLPVKRFLCASNKNNILTDFLSTGVYDRNRAFYTTMSPSMDILISSNLERLLFCKVGAEQTAKYMKELNETGRYEVSPEVLASIREDFTGYFCDEEKTADVIRRTFADGHYLIDPHTAVGVSAAEQYLAETGDTAVKMVVDSTASPYKFASNVCRSLTGKAPEDEFDALEALSKYSGTEIPAPLAAL
ncbi:MAG: threonine synthase, partial [Clostridia bacterium]|nr:threonine synthase [Clostridia bacterium]